MIDKIYLQKSAQYQSVEYVGVDEEGVVGRKQSIPFVVQAIPEVTSNGQWLAKEIEIEIS